MKILKAVLKTLVSLWSIFCLLCVIGGISHFSLPEWIFTIIFFAVPYVVFFLLIGKINRRAKPTEVSENKISVNTETAQNELKNTTNAEVAEAIVPHSEVHSEITNDTYIETSSTICRADGKPIAEKDTPYLIQITLEDALKKANESSIIFRRTEKDDELSFRFMENHADEIQKHTYNFEKKRTEAHKENDLDKKIKLLEETIAQFEKSKNWFYRTKGGTIYFQDFYEHLHNSQNPDFSYIEPVQEYLDYCLQKRDYIIPQILHTISFQRQIMQKDIYQYLPDIPKSEIQKVIRELERDNKISREKKGSSYILRLK